MNGGRRDNGVCVRVQIGIHMKGNAHHFFARNYVSRNRAMKGYGLNCLKFNKIIGFLCFYR